VIKEATQYPVQPKNNALCSCKNFFLHLQASNFCTDKLIRLYLSFFFVSTQKDNVCEQKLMQQLPLVSNQKLNCVLPENIHIKASMGTFWFEPLPTLLEISV